MKDCARIPAVTEMDRHHCCWPKRQGWNVGYAHLICQAFVRYVPIVYHRELHAKMRGVPIPPAKLLRAAWEKYQANKDKIDSYDVCRACAWLYVNIPDTDFRKAMQYQIDFFVTKMGRSS